MIQRMAVCFLTVLYVLSHDALWAVNTTDPAKTSKSFWSFIFGSKLKAEEVVFFDKNDNPYHFNNFKGKPFIMNIWATWCGPCVQELPSLEALARALKSHDVQIVPVLLSNSYGQGVSVFYRMRIQAMNLYYDRDKMVETFFSVKTLPLTIFFDKDGKEVYRHTGSLNWTSSQALELVKKHLGVDLLKKS